MTWGKRGSPQYKKAQKLWERKNRKSINARRRANRDPKKSAIEQRRVRYGLSDVAYNEMYQNQKGRCAACGEIPKMSKRGQLVVDHDHRTNQVRGLLCHPCNLTAGHLEHPRRSAVEAYLRRTAP